MLPSLMLASHMPSSQLNLDFLIFSGTAAVAFIRHSVRGNEIGLGSKNQQAYFFGPGSYRRIGVGVEFETTVAIGRTDKEVIIQHMGVTYVDLPQGYAAVIQQVCGLV